MDIPRPSKRRSVLGLVMKVVLVVGVLAGVFCVFRDGYEAKRADKAEFNSIGNYVSIETLGFFRGNRVYIITDKAGNKWFVNDNVAIPLKDSR